MRDLTQGNIHKNFILFSIPIILSSVLSSLFGIIDTSIAGLFLGTKGIAATGATAAFFSAVSSFPVGYIMGSSAIIARLFAAKEYRSLKRVFYANTLLFLGISVLLCLAGMVLRRPIFAFLKVDEAITAEARNYYFTMCANLICHIVSYFFSVCINAMGVTSFPLYVSILTSVLNIVGNLLSVTILDLGVLGIGLSTVFSNFVGMVLVGLRIRSYFTKMNVKHIKIRLRRPYFTSIVSYGTPSGSQQLFLYLAGLLMSPLRNGMGYAVVAVMSLVGRISSIIETAYYSSSRTIGNYIAQCIGAKKYHKIKPAIGVAYIHAYALFLPILIFFWCFPSLVVGLFLKQENDPATFAELIRYIKIFLPFILLNQSCSVFHSIFRSVKSGRHLLVASMINSFGNLIISYLLAPPFGITGLYLGTIGGAAAEVIYICVIFLSGKWVPRDLRPLLSSQRKKPKKAE